jgi:DNA-binding response OmpR family regulator
MSPMMIPASAPVLPLHAWPGGFGDDGEAATDPAGTPPRCSLKGKRVLLVEDEAMLAFELQYALEEAGATVIGPALTLGEALAMREQHEHLDGAVLDVNLAGQSVVPLAHELARVGVPILFNTGHAARSELQALFPTSEVLSKPSQPELLAERLAELIERPVPN